MLPPGLSLSLAQALVERGYSELTAVQVAVAEPDALRRDLLVSSKTGSGKTVAYGLTMADTLLGPDGVLAPAAAPLALVIAPTRELALQVERELAWLYVHARARVTSCVGGMDPRREQRALAAGTHIVVGTPGRLRDHLERGQLDLSALQVVVLDEADEMLDLGFREELEALLDAAPADRRTLLFSATLPKPILTLARRYQRDALNIAIDDRGGGHADIDYRAIAIAPSDVEHATVNLLRFFEPGSAIVFCSTREAVRRLHANLAERGFSAVALSGELTQNERAHALQALRDRRARVCVATDVAARGIDIPDLELVIHAELPHDAQALQHRSGRTGRAGRKGVSAILVPYPRRRRAEGMLRTAGVAAQWQPAPSAEDIRGKDQERLIAELQPDGEISEDDLAVARVLLSGENPEVVVATLVRAQRASLPAPEDLAETTSEPAPVFNDKPRPGFEDTAWYAIDIGRNRNAEARWILPLLCRRGHITKREIGAIRIFERETRFEIVRTAVERFDTAIAASEEDGVHITPLAHAEEPAPRGRAAHGVKPKGHFKAKPRATPKPARPAGADKGTTAKQRVSKPFRGKRDARR
ncbi:MAG TPA: DEAD/DEAH box helicase [Caulobacteraceae bacterium]|nr:DEAD/DEAH box helicase [Caulobacteraceae bacterium]